MSHMSKLWEIKWGGLFYLRLGHFCIRLVFVAYGNLSAPRRGRVKFAWIFFVFHPVFDVKFWWNFPLHIQTLENVARKISPKFHAKFHDTFGREKRRKFSLPHFCRAAALIIWFGLFLLTVAIRFGLFCLQWKSVWSFLLTVPPRPPVRKLDLVFFTYGSPP